MKRDAHASIQYGYVVDDLEAAMNAWRQRTDLGPFYLLDNVRVGNALYRGTPSEFTVSAALAQCGSVQVELLVQHSTAPSAFTEGADGRPCRLHHAGYLVEDAEATIAALAAQGHAVVTSGVANGVMPFAYIDTTAVLGHMMEISPNMPAATEMFETVRRAAIDWDGRDPVRRL